MECTNREMTSVRLVIHATHTCRQRSCSMDPMPDSMNGWQGKELKSQFTAATNIRLHRRAVRPIRLATILNLKNIWFNDALIGSGVPMVHAAVYVNFRDSPLPIYGEIRQHTVLVTLSYIDLKPVDFTERTMPEVGQVHPQSLGVPFPTLAMSVSQSAEWVLNGGLSCEMPIRSLVFLKSVPV